MKPILLLLLLTASACAGWREVAGGVGYRSFTTRESVIHVARVDLDNPGVRVVTTDESDRGLKVSEFAARTKALVAVNGDYFDAETHPIGLAAGRCGVWEGTKDTEREGVVAVGAGRITITPQREAIGTTLEPWMRGAVSGWPMLVKECHALTAEQLPGSDRFTRAPHSRTAAGLSRDGRTFFLVVADGRRKNVPGLTLAALGAFLQKQLGVCEAINLDGGGSSAMWVKDRIVNQPSDGVERPVADHVAVILAADDHGCESGEQE